MCINKHVCLTALKLHSLAASSSSGPLRATSCPLLRSLAEEVKSSSLFLVIDVIETEHWLSSSRSSSASVSYVSLVRETHILLGRLVEEVAQLR